MKTNDCLLIGHNDVDFSRYVESIKKMGKHSGAYHDLNLSFLQYKGKPYHASGIFNLLTPGVPPFYKPLRSGETFSAAIAYLGTYLHRRGFTFDYINSFRDEQEELKSKLEKGNILTIAVITTLYVSVFPVLEIMEFIKKTNSEARVIVGGPFIATQARVTDADALQFLFNSIGADFYVNSSRGEAALVGIIDALKNNRTFDNINNIYYKTHSGYIATPILKENNNLSENMVQWDLFSGKAGEYIDARTSISCPFSCAFCGFPQHAGKYQTADIAAIEKELNGLNRLGTVKSVYFIDDTLNVPVKRFKAFLNMLIKNKYPFRWHSQARCQFIDREAVELMKASGCEGVFLGLESGNDQILKHMNKAADAGEYMKGIGLLKEYEIPTYGSFIIGFPGETEETVKDTVRLIEGSGIDFYRTQLWYCEPITPIWQEREKFNIAGSNFEWAHATMDSKRACDLIEEIFLSVKTSTWLPQYRFDFVTLFHLTQRGIPMDRVKHFLNVFNRGTAEKLLDPAREEVGEEIMARMAGALAPVDLDAPGLLQEETAVVENLTADFDLD